MSLREITPANRAAVEALTVTAGQTKYVAGVAESLVEAAQTPDACPWYRAVYAGGTPVGFVMISDGITVVNPDYLGPYFLWRLLIDQHHQGRGYGTAALSLVVEYVRTRADARVLITSVGQGPASPLGFYLRQGFRATGEVHQGELVLELDLPRSPPPADSNATSATASNPCGRREGSDAAHPTACDNFSAGVGLSGSALGMRMLPEGNPARLNLVTKYSSSSSSSAMASHSRQKSVFSSQM